VGTKLAAIVKRPDVEIESLVPHVPEFAAWPRSVLRRVAIELKYEGYIARDQRAIQGTEELDRVRIPAGFSFADLPGLRREIVEKLHRHKPETLGQASRISGVTPAALQLLRVHLRNR
jgi:tRNA uridine 5-carboxymethylaminomethyl modification enzyme